MTKEQERALQASEDFSKSPHEDNKAPEATNKDFFVDSNEPVLPINQPGDEVTNNDGSIIETLDTAFHNQPGVIKDHSPAGSNRAEYYEAKSQGKSDAEEEQDFLRKQQH
jgi:hypothetical protein